jgi:PAS domain S-box-containing protein
MGHLRPLVACHRSGAEFPIEATISQVTIDGHAFGAAIVRDISARVAAEAALEQAADEKLAGEARETVARAEAAAMAAERDRLRQLLDGLPSGVLILEAPDGEIQFANSTLRTWLYGHYAQVDAPLIYGRDLVFLRADGLPLPSQDRPGIRALRGEIVRGHQLVLERPGGHRFPISAHASPVVDGHGTVRTAIVVIQDVTDLRQAEQLKDDFLALISHEFRTPLTAIHGGAHLLAHDADTLDEAARQELLLDVVTESERLDRMLRNILVLANVLGGRLRVETEPVLITAVARSVADEVKRIAPFHDIRVAVPSDVPPIEADPDLLRQILRNIVENAVKYSPDVGQIRITAGWSADEVAIHVSDQGVGIAPEHVASVFERFRRVGSDLTVRGMGLGLYLSRHLVEAQGGRIEASSPGLGSGTTMSITFPVADGWEAGDDGAGTDMAGPP